MQFLDTYSLFALGFAVAAYLLWDVKRDRDYAKKQAVVSDDTKSVLAEAVHLNGTPTPEEVFARVSFPDTPEGHHDLREWAQQQSARVEPETV